MNEKTIVLEFGPSRKLISTQENQVNKVFRDIVAARCQSKGTLLLQYFSSEWGYIDLDDGADLLDKMIIRCIDVPVVSSDSISECAVDTEPPGSSNNVGTGLSDLRVMDFSSLDLPVYVQYDAGSGCESVRSELNPSGSAPSNCSFSSMNTHALSRDRCSLDDTFMNEVEGKMSFSLKNSLQKKTSLMWNDKHELLNLLGNCLYERNTHPDKKIRDKVAECLVEKYPHLKENIGTGFDAWERSIDNWLKNKRRKDGTVIPKSANIRKKPRRGEVNWNPDLPHSESSSTIQHHKTLLQKEYMKKNYDKGLIKSLMNTTYADRRSLVNNNISVEDLKKEYPTLFFVDELLNEFHRLMDCNLDESFQKYDASCAPGIVKLATERKVKTEKMKMILDLFHR